MTMDSVKTYVDEGQSFLSRNDDLDAQQSSFGSLLWASMRAMAECPDCPGAFRIPHDSDWTPNAFGEWKYLACPKCQKVWELTSKPERPKTRTPRRRRTGEPQREEHNS